jgi:hypothetical protein
MTRRTLLVAVLSLTALSLALLGREKSRTPRRSQLERRAVRSLQRLLGAEAADAPPLRLDDWSRQRALEHLLLDLSPGQLAAILSDNAALLDHLERLQRGDLKRGRLHLVDGWLLSATEISVAVLVAARSAR